MFYSHMKREGLCLKGILVSDMSRQLSKNRKFKVLKNKVVVEISTYLHSRKRFKANKQPVHIKEARVVMTCLPKI